MKLAIYGKLRAGKSEVAEAIKREFDTEVIEFSKALRDVCDILYPTTRNYKDRDLLVKIGQHMREMDKDIWVNIVKEKIENSDAEHIIVASVRQKNEYDMLKKLGFKFINVEAYEHIRKQRCIDAGDKFSEESFNSYLETDMDAFDYDYMVVNNKDFKSLNMAIKNLLVDLKSIDDFNHSDSKIIYQDDWREVVC